MSGDEFGALTGFAEALRGAGITVGVDRIAVAAEALAHWGVAGGADPYWPLRLSFCSGPDDLVGFDAVYRRTFHRDPPVEAGPVAVPAEAFAFAFAEVPGAEGGEDTGADHTARLSTRDFDELTEAELREVVAWVDLLRPVPLRRTMHHRPARSGAVDPARTMRLMLRNGGELVRVRHRRPASRPRRVLLLVDISASMHPYSDVLLRFAHAALAAGPRTTEVFTVGTRHTHLTRSLRARRPEVAFPAAGRVRADWSEGTTLGVALGGFLRRWGGSSALRSAIVVLGSDGVESGDSTLMIMQVDRLARLARTLIWVDPARRSDGGPPADVHIARAQASAGRVLGCQSYEALRELAKVITHA